MAALTADQRATISTHETFLNRIGQVLRDKAQYWKNFTLSARSDVNQTQQKRKRFAKSILTVQGYAETIRVQVGNYWLTTYTDDPAVLDGGGIPTAAVIGNTFDPTYDFFAGVVAGDESQTEIDW